MGHYRTQAGLGVVLGFVMMGCATVMHGTTQDVGFASTPSGAKIMVNAQPQGTTPAVIPLSRKEHHVVKMELPGYEPYEATLTRGMSGWVFGNIVIGGLIGLTVDAVSGGMYTLSPEQIMANLVKADGDGMRPEVPGTAPAVGLRPPSVSAAPVPHPGPPPAPLPAVTLATASTTWPGASRVDGPMVRLQPKYEASRLYLQAHPDAERLSWVSSSAMLQVLEDRGAWLYIQTPDERRGWILREWLQH